MRAGLLDGLEIETLMSHLACADEDEAMNGRQRAAFAELAGTGAGEAAEPRQQRRHLPRRGLCLRPHPARPRALRRRAAARGGGAYPPGRPGRGADRPAPPGRGGRSGRLWRAPSPPSAPAELAILNIGYADGYLRGFSGTGRARIGDGFAPVVGRVSMDLTAICVDEAPELAEGDWVELDYDLPRAVGAVGPDAI